MPVQWSPFDSDSPGDDIREPWFGTYPPGAFAPAISPIFFEDSAEISPMPFSIGNFITGAFQGLSDVAASIGTVRSNIALITGQPVAPPAVVPTAPPALPAFGRSGGFIPGPNDRFDPFPFGSSITPTPVGLLPAIGGTIAGAVVPSLLPTFGNELPGLQLPDFGDQGLPTTFAGQRPTKAQIRSFLLKSAGVNWTGFLCIVKAYGANEAGNRMGLEPSAMTFLLGNKPRRRSRGITGPQLRNVNNTLRRLNTINARVKEMCKGVVPATRRRSSRKPC